MAYADFADYGACSGVTVCGSATASMWLAQMQAQQYQRAQARSYPTSEQTARVESLLKGKKVEKGLFSSMKDGVTEFFSENRSVITWLALIFLVDHFFFKGAFRERLHRMVEGMIGKIEKKIENA